MDGSSSLSKECIAGSSLPLGSGFMERYRERSCTSHTITKNEVLNGRFTDLHILRAIVSLSSASAVTDWKDMFWYMSARLVSRPGMAEIVLH